MFKVVSPDVVYNDDSIESKYVYRNTRVDGNSIIPYEEHLMFKTSTIVPKTGLLLVGLGG